MASALALGLDAGDLAVEGVLAGAGLLGLAVEEMEAEQERRQSTASTAMAMRNRLSAGPRLA